MKRVSLLALLFALTSCATIPPAQAVSRSPVPPCTQPQCLDDVCIRTTEYRVVVYESGLVGRLQRKGWLPVRTETIVGFEPAGACAASFRHAKSQTAQ